MRVTFSTKNDGVAVDHIAEYKGFKVTVSNYPGTRTIIWEVSLRQHRDFVNSAHEDRYECNVKQAKEKAIEHCDKLIERWLREGSIVMVDGRVTPKPVEAGSHPEL